MSKKCVKAFTLAELLIALAILGVIATFTIPKVLQAQGKEDRYSRAREVSSTLAAVTQKYALENGGCLPGMSCRFDTGTGTVQDGLTTNADCWGSSSAVY